MSDRELVRFTSADGTLVACWRSGRGMPLVLVHGISGSDFSFGFLAPELEDRFELYAMQRRGRGESEDSEDYSLDREAEDVAAVVEGIDRPAAVMGHSWGANVVLEASLLVGNASRLILYDPSVRWPYKPEFMDQLDELLERGDREGLVVAMFREGGITEEELRAIRSAPSWDLRLALAHTIPREIREESAYELRPERFRDMGTPTLLLTGSESEKEYGEAIARIDEVLPNSEVAVLPGHGHAGIMTGPDLVAAEVTRFVEAGQGGSPPSGS